MSKQPAKCADPNQLTVEEAASLLGVGQKEIHIRFSNGSLTRRRASNGELRISRLEVDALARKIPKGETGK